MLNLHTLMRATPWNIVNNAGDVNVVKKNAWVEKDDKGEHKVFSGKLLTRGPDKKPRNVTIKMYGSRTANGQMRRKTRHPVWVHCDCEYFLYYLEVAVTARGSSSVITSNGNFPKIRNPRMKPYLCKHLLRASREAWKEKPKKRQVSRLTAMEIDDMVKLAQPFIPR